jgi:hypothetical protein
MLLVVRAPPLAGPAVEVEPKAATPIPSIDRQIDRPPDGWPCPPEEKTTDPALVLHRLTDFVTETEKLLGGVDPARCRDSEGARGRVREICGVVSTIRERTLMDRE